MGSLSCIRDLSKQRQRDLYDEVRRLKSALAEKVPVAQRDALIGPFKLNAGNAWGGCCYLVFMEDSTRTKESFRNAALFHDNLKVNIFDCQTSSFTKGETVTDTLKMLMGYSTGRSIFVIRSKIEGLTRWLETALTEYAEKEQHIERPCIINAGDGKHEHPTQELLDNFTFLEHMNFDYSRIHVALIGDLCHGRTVHSKTDGLAVFDSVSVDLIAPPELAMPEDYVTRMKANGFTVRTFSSIDAYLNDSSVAAVWYFTRLQLERMQADVVSRAAELSASVTYNPIWRDRLPPNTKFYHPLPRNAENPVIPFETDNALNGWDQQSRNGYFTRIILLKQLDNAQVAATSRPEEAKLEPAYCCGNAACVSHPSQKQRDVLPCVVRQGDKTRCYYCDYTTKS